MTATLDQIDAEIIRCSNPLYFIHNYCKLPPKNDPFRLWPDQVESLKTMRRERFVAMLKARQTGFTSLIAADTAHHSIYDAPWTTLLFSKSHQEAKDLLKRIRATFKGLPEWLQPRGFTKDSTTELELTNGSRLISFGSMASGGDSYTADVVVIDEADLIRNLDILLSGAKPTIDAGGKLVILSRSEKSSVHAEKSSFKNIMRAALAGRSEFQPIFVPWWARPGRNAEWYRNVAKEIEDRTFSRDELYANYPASPEEALAARELDKRFPVAKLLTVFQERKPLPIPKGTPFKGWQHLIEFYKLPEPDRRYVLGADVAKGNPNSDDSTGEVLDAETLEECAVLCGKIEPTVHGYRCALLARYYSNAEILPERNAQHGTKFIESLRREKARILMGRDKHLGWWTDEVSKNLMYDSVAEQVRVGGCVIHSKATFDQLASLDVANLEAPFGSHDDRAIGFALAVQAAVKRIIKPEIQIVTADSPSSSTPRPETKYTGIRYLETYDCWTVHIDGGAIGFGDFSTDRAAALATNMTMEALGRDPENVLPPDPADAETAEKARKYLRDKGLLK